jgi:hypothetical protein
MSDKQTFTAVNPIAARKTIPGVPMVPTTPSRVRELIALFDKPPSKADVPNNATNKAPSTR